MLTVVARISKSIVKGVSVISGVSGVGVSVSIGVWSNDWVCSICAYCRYSSVASYIWGNSKSTVSYGSFGSLCFFSSYDGDERKSDECNLKTKILLIFGRKLKFSWRLLILAFLKPSPSFRTPKPTPTGDCATSVSNNEKYYFRNFFNNSKIFSFIKFFEMKFLKLKF